MVVGFNRIKDLNVALRKESVDRNRIIAKEYDWDALSLSARRAWIEINKRRILPKKCIVALRKESVDRNVFAVVIILPSGVALRKESVDRNKELIDKRCKLSWSLSARRAWIEMQGADTGDKIKKNVALRKESVDRNEKFEGVIAIKECRSPQGERG